MDTLNRDFHFWPSPTLPVDKPSLDRSQHLGCRRVGLMVFTPDERFPRQWLTIESVAP